MLSDDFLRVFPDFLWLQMQIFGDEHSEYFIEILHHIPVDGAFIVAHLMPDFGERICDQVEDRHAFVLKVDVIVGDVGVIKVLILKIFSIPPAQSAGTLQSLLNLHQPIVPFPSVTF